MHDAASVSFFERARNLVSNRAHLVEGDPALRYPVGKRGAFHEFQHQRQDMFGFFETVDRPNVGMTERGEHVGFALKSAEALLIAEEQLGQDF